MSQRGRSDMYRSPTNTSNQGSIRKVLRMQNHQNQDALRSSVSHIRDLQAKIPNVQKCQIIRVPTDDEGLQDRN